MGTILFQILSTHCSNPESEQKQSRNQKHIIEQRKHTDHVCQSNSLNSFISSRSQGIGRCIFKYEIDNQNENKIVIQRSSLNPRKVSEKAVKHAYT